MKPEQRSRVDEIRGRAKAAETRWLLDLVDELDRIAALGAASREVYSSFADDEAAESAREIERLRDRVAELEAALAAIRGGSA